MKRTTFLSTVLVAACTLILTLRVFTAAAFSDGVEPLSQVKVATVYGSIIDQIRDPDAVAQLLREMNTDFVFRGFFRWRGLAEIERKHDVYGALGDAIDTMKAHDPNVIICGALAAQEINVVEHDPLTDETIPSEETMKMALDPEDYGFSLSREELLHKYWQKAGSRSYIFPDITNPHYQKLLLDFAKKQIDSGVDAIWIDGLYAQAGIFARLSGEVRRPSVKAAFAAASHIVDAIKQYGKLKGKTVYVGSWSSERWYEEGLPKGWYPKLDFVTASPSAKEVANGRLNEEKWTRRVRLVKEIYGEVPIFAFIDWAFTADTPLGVFSQRLNREEQAEALRNFDKRFREWGIIFAYPVHGGYMGRDATTLAFGKLRKYDSLAPEFATFKTIQELAASRAQQSATTVSVATGK